MKSNRYVAFVILMVIKIDIAIAANYYYSTHYTKEDAIAAQDRIRQQCSESVGIFVTSPVTSGTQYDETIWRFQWKCLVCETSPAVFVVLKRERENCLRNCFDDSVVRCIDEGDASFSISDCGESIHDDPRYPQCKNDAESSSSSQNNNSSCSNGESSSSNNNASSSSSDSGNSGSSSSSSVPDDNDDFDQCFSSYGEAMTANLLRRGECIDNGGDISGLDVVLHPEDYLWCLIGSCDTPSSSSSSDAGDICRATAGELTDIMANLIADCIIGKPENNHNYNIEYLKNNPPEKLFCITGMCNFSESSSSGECAGIGSSCPSSSSSSLFSSSSMITKAPCTHKTCSECDDTRGDILDLRPMYNCIDLSYDCDKIFYVTSVSFGTFNASTGAPGCFRFIGKSSLEEIKVACQSSCNLIANSSSSTVSSSSCVESSSSESLFSSSSSVFTSSSSIVFASSSSVAFVSSSSFNTDLDFYVCQVCKPFIAGPNASYNPEDVFISGLNNMEPGKCYGLNPDRDIQYGWINDNAQDRWWWEERPCDGSKPIEPVTPNGCRNNKRDANAIYTASDCFSNGLDNMEPGKCYGLNPDRGIQYGWINNDAQDRWWWREVPCGMIFLPKKDISESNSDYMQQGETKLFYDAAGRKTTTNTKIRRFIFSPKKTP